MVAPKKGKKRLLAEVEALEELKDDLEEAKVLLEDLLAKVQTLLEEKIPAVWAELDLTRERAQEAAGKLEGRLDSTKSWTNN